MPSLQGYSVLLLLALIWILWRLFSNREGSFFKLRESERLKRAFELGELRRKNEKKHKDALAQAKIEVRKTPLLSGFSTQGAPHELLGVRETASEKEIKNAYKEKMKQYHPDRIGPQGSREWQDAQSIAMALNEAKEAMLTKLKK